MIWFGHVYAARPCSSTPPWMVATSRVGEETTIPIPRSDEGVEELLTHLEVDRDEVEETCIEDLEDEIDDAVFDLFELTEEERNVVENYLEVF